MKIGAKRWSDPAAFVGDMDTLAGLIADFDHAIIVHKDITYFGRVRKEISELTIEYGKLVHVEILVGGYNDDETALYEVPEVKRWIKLIHTRWPDTLMWLNAREPHQRLLNSSGKLDCQDRLHPFTIASRRPIV